MKKYKKTYAIFHLTEKHTVFFLGKTKVHVSFTGGIVTKKGVTPATFTTDDPIVQLAIENSAEFKKGAIKLRSKYPMQGEIKVGRNPHIEEAPCHIPANMFKTDITGDNVKPDSETEAEEAPQPEDVAAHAEEGEGLPDNEPPSEDINAMPEPSEEVNKPEYTKGRIPEVVEVSCKDVAKQYLQEHFGENPTPLRKIADVQECAAKYGIIFEFV